MTITVELRGLELWGHHGVEDEERRAGQTFLFDVEYDVSDAAAGDDIGATVDYRDVLTCLAQVSEGHRFQLLEALAATAAETLLQRFEIERAWVRVRKPGVRLERPAEYSAAACERRRT